MTSRFSDLGAFRALLSDLPQMDAGALQQAADRNDQLTKPPGALGRLEELGIWYAGWRSNPKASVKASQVIVFAGNHGVAAQGVSAFPAEVTEQMVLNFQLGGAAVNQIARSVGASLDVVPLDLNTPTQDFTQGPAMTEDDLLRALQAGWDAVNGDTDLLVVGEMGIGNTTAAAALACALLGGSAADWTGRGTGIDDAGLANKTRVVAEGVALHAGQGDGIETLRCLGGRELAGMVGAIVRARTMRVPVILDGFICCAAALALLRTAPSALDHTVPGHLSAEAGHARLLEEMGQLPLLNLGLRLGEASGAALAIGIVQAAVACMGGMATFAEAGVST
jgi:nicotinate-nucleotide--dimethylbenzimidazole phosphoribosyltransferase